MDASPSPTSPQLALPITRSRQTLHEQHPALQALPFTSCSEAATLHLLRNHDQYRSVSWKRRAQASSTPDTLTASVSAMPSILNDDDRETVKRFVPKQTNKIHAVAVARLYVAYPNRSKWTYTGLQGAVVLANDLVGNTYWVKMVDISVGL